MTGETLAPRAGQGDGYNFETLRNVPGRDAPAATYREACELRGPLRDDKEWHDTMDAAVKARLISKFMFPSLRLPSWEELSSGRPRDPRKLTNCSGA